MSGYIDGVGHNSADTSRAAAAALADSGEALRQAERVLASVAAAGQRGITMDEAIPALRMKAASYTGRRSELHQQGAVVRLTEIRGGQHVYVIPAYIASRELDPFTPNSTKPAPPPPIPQAVLAAARDVARWANAQKHAGLIVVAPEWESVDVLTAHILDAT